MAPVATACDDGNRDTDIELAGSVHRVLAILADLRSDAPEPELRDRIALVRWPRGEPTEVEKLLTLSHDRRTGASSRASSVAAR
jgi:hypothetical protein